MLTAVASFVGVREIAERFGVDRSTVHQWVLKGRLTVAKQLPGPTGALLFDAAEIDRLAAENDAEATA